MRQFLLFLCLLMVFYSVLSLIILFKASRILTARQYPIESYHRNASFFFQKNTT